MRLCQTRHYPPFAAQNQIRRRQLSLLKPAQYQTSRVPRSEKLKDAPMAIGATDNKSATKTIDAIFAKDNKIPLAVSGTNFQVNVWRALLAIPPGCVAGYGALARAIGCAKAVRAVGRAAAANPVAVLIPCHRLLATNGALTGYAWGLERKQALLAHEFCR